MVSERLTFGGLASGIDTNLIIDQLMAMQRRPIRLAENQRSLVQERMKALGTLGSQLSTLLSRTSTLQNTDTFRARNTSVLAKEIDRNKISVTANATAATGSFSVHVTQLATQTRASSATPAGQAIDAGVPLNEAGFGATFKPGTFSINGTAFTIANATATSVVSNQSVGAGFDPSVPLADATLGIAADDEGDGRFTINGVQISWTAATDSLNDVIGYINDSAAGVTASYDAEVNGLRLTSNTTGESAITYENDTGNFFRAMRMTNPGGNMNGVVTPGEDVASLNDVIAMINDAAIGVTATLEEDADGRPNLLRLSSDSAIQLGSGGDTSNFLSLTSLLQSAGGTTRTSVRGLGALDPGANLADARMATALTATSGSFKINGVAITYNAESESLQNVMTRINGSGAGVTATYDAHADRLVLTHNESGSTAIQIEDVEGNFLAAFGLAGTPQTIGQNAAYQIDGGPTRYSTSNTITDAISGVTITARDVTTEALKVDITQSTQTVAESVDAFVKQFNTVLGLIREATKYNEDGPNGVLFGDGTVRRIEQSLRSIVTRAVPGLAGGIRTAADVGLSFGAVGAAVGSTNELKLDTAKLTKALQTEPEAVSQFFSGFLGTAALEPDGTGSIESISGAPTSVKKTGRYEITSNGSGQLSVTFIPNDGSTPATSTGTISASGTNTTLIPGVTLTAKDTLVAGTNVITIGAEREGIAKQLHEFVDSLTRTGGLLSNRNEEMQKRVTDINAQIGRVEQRLAVREEQLLRQFAAMEQAFARMQTQQQALTQMQQQLANLRPPQRR